MLVTLLSQVHLKNWRHYICITRVTIVTLPGGIMSYLNGILPLKSNILWLRDLARPQYKKDHYLSTNVIATAGY